MVSFSTATIKQRNSSGLLLKADIARYSQHVANVPRGSLERRDFSRLHLFNRPLFVDLVCDLDLTIRGPLPGACRGNDQLRERGRGVLRRRTRRRQRSDLRPIVAGNWRPSTAKVMVADAAVGYFMSDMDISILQLTAAGWPS